MGTGGFAAGPATDAGPDAPAPPARPTRRGRRVLLGAVLVVVLALGAVAVRLVGLPDAWLPGVLAGPACSVTTADGETGLDLADAQRLTTAALATTPPAGLPASDRASSPRSVPATAHSPAPSPPPNAAPGPASPVRTRPRPASPRGPRPSGRRCARRPAGSRSAVSSPAGSRPVTCPARPTTRAAPSTCSSGP